MQPVGRTVSFDRDWIVNHLEDVNGWARNQWKVEIARGSNFFPANQDFHKSWSKDAGLIGRDDFVLNAAPGDAASEQGCKEIEQVQEWNEQCNHNINPGLRHDFRTGRRNCFRYSNHPQCATEGREE